MIVLVQSTITNSPAQWAIIIAVYASSRMRRQWEYGVAGKPTHMDIPNFPTSYYNPCRKDKWNVVCVVYDTPSSKSSLWVNHRKIYDFACRLHLKASTLNLFNKVIHFDDASGFDGYNGSVEIYNYYKYIPSGLIAVWMTYLCGKYKIPKSGSTIIWTVPKV